MVTNPLNKQDKKFQELQRKVLVEQKVLTAANAMLSQLKDPMAIDQCKHSIQESEKRLEFLTFELERIQPPSLHVDPEIKNARKKSFQDNSIQLEARVARTRSFSGLDTTRSDVCLSAHKVIIKINDLTYKLEVEQKMKEASAKMAAVYAKDARQQKQVSKTSLDCNYKIAMLKQSLHKYQSLYVGDEVEGEEAKKNRNLRKPMTGNIQLKLVNAMQLALSRSSPAASAIVCVDGNEKGKTKISKSCRWDEEFTFSIEKQTELQISFYDSSDVIVGICWFKFAEIEEELRILKEAKVIETHVVESWWEVEPVGRVFMKIKFEKTNALKSTPSLLGRNRAMRKKNRNDANKVVINGHPFIQHRFYQIIQCAVCNEFLLDGLGYRCLDCNYACHQKCSSKVLVKCISRSNEDVGTSDFYDKVHHRIHHRFERVTNLGPAWCAHCGQLVRLTRKMDKCTECSVVCHPDCQLYVPDFCGLSILRAYEIYTSMTGAAQIRKLKPNTTTTLTLSNKTLAAPTAPEEKLQSETVGITKFASRLSLKSRTRTPSHNNTLDDFNFLAVLGKGNFGKVMLSEEKATGRLYAIKVLKKDFILQNDEVEGLKSEKRVFLAANQQRHPFLVGLYSCFQTDSRVYFVMEYISGGDLMLHIQRRMFNEQQAKFYAAEVLLALEYFHQQGIVYRDLKLDNILLAPDGHIKIADYGLCKERMAYGKLTNTFCGTPEFMAPEILLEQGYGRAVDWWAFGVLLYEMLLGQSPFKGDDEDEIFESILEDDILLPLKMSRNSVSIIQGLLTRDPRKRLGGGPDDAVPIKQHPFFFEFDWNDIYNKKIPPPFKPNISDNRDISNFDTEFTNESPVLTPVQTVLTKTQQLDFHGFSYEANWNE